MSNDENGKKRRNTPGGTFLGDILNLERSGNVTIKSVAHDKEISKVQKNLGKILDQIEQKEQEKTKLTLLRDENNNNTRVMFKQAEESKEKRNQCNEEVKELKEQKKVLYDKKDELQARKKELIQKMDEETDSKAKSAMYQEMVAAREELNQVFDQLKTITQDLNTKISEGQSEHENMLAYRQMGQQAKRIADDYHKQLKQIYSELRELRKQRGQTRHKVNTMEY